MAYRDITDSVFAAPAMHRRIAGAASAIETATFSALEWSVIAVARRDRIASLEQPGRIARALGSVFGLSTESRLADPALESLRRLAVHAWRRGYALPASEVARFLGAGYSMDHAELLVASVTGGHVGQLAWRIAA